MFNKKKCKKCGKKSSKEFDFCPYCGNSTNDNSKNEDWGMLGKNDFFNDAEIKLPFGFNVLLNSLMKNLDKEFRELDKEIGKEEKQKNQKSPMFKNQGGISISISTSGNSPPKIKVNSFGNVPEFQEEERELKKIASKSTPMLSDKNIKKLSNLPREEPSSNIRRLSNKIVYEINLPGVKSIEDISIIKLENSIEIKAIGKEKAYFKLIPINYPIKNYKLSDEKLVLELDARG